MNKISNKIIASAKKGDIEAIDVIIEQYSNLVYYLCSKYIKDPMETDDCAQEVLIRVIKVLETFDGNKSDFNTWMYKVTDNAVINYYNNLNRYRKKIENNEEVVYHYIDDRKYNDDSSLLLSDLEKVIGEENYKVLMLKIGFNYKFHEISEITGLSLSKTKRTYYEALKLVEDYKRGLYEKER